MSEKIVNLGKVKARTLDLKVEDKIIKKKYDDETEWQPLVDLGEAGSSIDTVSGYSELPTDAKENDVAIVEEEEYVRTENETVILPIEVKLPTEDQYVPNIYNINFRDSFNSILNNEEVKSLGSVLNIRLETETRDIMYVDIGVEIAPMMAGVDHPVQVVAVMNSDEDMNFYVSGISIRDFLQLMMELELEEEQWVILLGSHANDNSADSPSYGWVNMVMSTEPINDNSLDMNGVYATLLFDSEAPKITDILSYASVGIMTTSGENIEASTSLYSTYDSSSDVDPEEQAFVLKFVNLALNNIAHGGIIEYSNDIYNPKGLFQNDNGEWVSLEGKMNTPRFVDTYADLPKTSIENGIMAVAKESIYRSEPELTTKLEMLKKYRINSVGDMTVEIFDNIIEEILPGYPTMGDIESDLQFMSFNGDQEMSIMIMRAPYSDTENLSGIQMGMYDYESNQEKRAICFVELPIDFDASSMFPPEQGSDDPLEFSPELGKWYWANIVDDKDSYSVGGIQEGFPTDLPEELLYYGGEIYWNEELYPAAVSEVSTYDSDPTNRKDIFSIDLKVFNFEDLSSSVTITYPAGFYRYNNNEWKHVEDVSGGNFENEDVLRTITATDVGNIQENTEKRHEHSNKSYLDQIQWDAIDKINNQVPRNTQARHTHNNKEVVDKLNQIHLDNAAKIPNLETSILSRSPSFYKSSSRRNLAYSSNNKDVNTYYINDSWNNPIIEVFPDGTDKSDQDLSERIVYFYCSSDRPIEFRCGIHQTFPFEGDIPQFIAGNQYKATCTVLSESDYSSRYYSYRVKVELATVSANPTSPSYLDTTKNYNYAKLVDGIIEYAPAYFIEQTDTYKSYIFNKPASYYKELGYKSVSGDAYPSKGEPYSHIEYREDNWGITRTVKYAPQLDESDKELLDKFSIVSDELRYDNIPITSYYLSSSLKSNVENGSVIELEERKITILDGIYGHDYVESFVINNVPIGESAISFNVQKSIKVKLPSDINWVGGVQPPLSPRDNNYRLIIKFNRNTLYDKILAEWFIGKPLENVISYPILADTRLIPQNVSSNFAKVTNGRLKFAPMQIDGEYNNPEIFESKGYKLVLGECPYQLTSQLTDSDECELMFKEFDEFIVVFWIVTPKGYRIGEYINTSEITNWSSYFSGWTGETLDDLLIGSLDTSSGTNFELMFNGCTNLKKVPSLDTRNGTDFYRMFYNCSSLEYVSALDLRLSEDCQQMFSNCRSLVTIEKLVCGSMSSLIMSLMFTGCSSLENVVIDGEILVDTDYLNLSSCTNLTVDSLMSFINAFVGYGTTVTLGSVNLAKLTPEQIAVATDKRVTLI